MTAWETYLDYRASSHIARGNPIPLNASPVLVNDPGEQPSGRSYAFAWHKYNFRLPIPYPPTFLQEISEAAGKDFDLSNFWKAYGKALADVRSGNPLDALDDIAKGIELALSGYSASAGDAGFGQPRLFVEKAAILLALDEIATRFEYLREYLLKPMFLLHGGRLIAERRPAIVFAKIATPTEWKDLMAKCEWDELLRYSRDSLLKDLLELPNSLTHSRRVARWDLARAVRARNALFHRGTPLQDQHLIAVLLRAFDLVGRLRLVAYRHGITWDRLVHLAEDDFAYLCAGGSPGPAALFASFGWRRWRSTHGDDIP